MVAVVESEEVERVQQLLHDRDEKTFVIGEIENYDQPAGVWKDVEEAVNLKGELVFEDFPYDLKPRKVG